MKMHSMLTISCALLCLAMPFSVAADDEKGAKTTRQDAPAEIQRMNKGEIISEIATAPVEEKVEKSERTSKPAKPQKPAKPTKPAKPAKPVKTELQAKPAEPQQSNDNNNSKSGGINTISSGCTLEEKLKGNKICKKD